MLNITDISIGKDMDVSMQSFYQYKGTVDIFKDMVQSAKDTIVKDMMERYPKSKYKIHFYLKNLKTMKTEGQCFIFGSKIMVLLNTKKVSNFQKMAEVLGHELVHAEQFMSGRLSLKGRAWHWDGQPVKSQGTTYQAYRNLPWEREAFDRQDKHKSILVNRYFERKAGR